MARKEYEQDDYDDDELDLGTYRPLRMRDGRSEKKDRRRDHYDWDD